MSSDSFNPFGDTFEVEEEDVKAPEWPPAEEHWPERPDLKTSVLSRKEAHEALQRFRR